MLLNINPLLALFFLVIGIFLLWKSADKLVEGAVGLAEHLGISHVVIGLTVVAMGTSAPEVAASIAATLKNAGDVAVGNVYGSNVANLALVGGMCSVISPIIVERQVLKREIPAMIIVALLLFPLIYDLNISRLEGAVLLLTFAFLLAVTIKYAKKRKKAPLTVQPYEIEKVPKKLTKEILFVIFGLAGVAVGADLTLRGAVTIGELLGLSQAVIGLTIVAIGTSLPELATSLVAALKGHSDISIGNLVGSNIFNTMLVIGIASLVKPIALTPRLKGIDYLIMITVSIIFALTAFLGKDRISKKDGLFLFTIYIGYMVYLLIFTRGF